MNIQELISRYVKAARAHGEATESGDHERANREHDKLTTAINELTACGGTDDMAFVALLHDSDPHVRCWVASHLLRSKTGPALQTLREVADSGGVAGFNAKMVVQEWMKQRGA